MSNSATVIEFVKRRKENLIKVFGSKCCICGFNKWQSALEFHHINPEEKEFGLTTSSTTKAIEKQLEEMKKCILVCSNCHRGIHSNNLTIPENWKDFYNNNIAKQLIEETHAKKHYCITCGKEKGRKGIYCPECAKIHQRKTDRPNREILKNLIRTTPFRKIGLDYGVSDNAIRKWCKAENLPSTKKEINSYTDEEWGNI